MMWCSRSRADNRWISFARAPVCDGASPNEHEEGGTTRTDGNRERQRLGYRNKDMKTKNASQEDIKKRKEENGQQSSLCGP
jgi:hypothetical protein